MNRTTPPHVLFIALLTITTAHLGAQAVPRKFVRAGASAPFFTSASLATETDGSIRWSAFAPMTQQIIQMKIGTRSNEVRALSQPATSEPCNERIITFTHPSGDVNSLDTMIASAKAVYRARVVSVNEGFDEHGSASAIIVGEIVRTLRKTGGFPSSGRLYLPYPKADFKIGGVRFCNAGPTPSFGPKTGDEVLIFAYDTPVDTTGSFLSVQPQQLIFERNHQLFAARPVASDANFLKTGNLRQVENTVTALSPAGEVVR
ncbi:MAG TPA: hypothetical protein VGQ65_00805 [Thermoanaerobaculia bacterium]|nr:hypothetical protein [Thermoanaerobaculia bacterium]